MDTSCCYNTCILVTDRAYLSSIYSPLISLTTAGNGRVSNYLAAGPAADGSTAAIRAAARASDASTIGHARGRPEAPSRLVRLLYESRYRRG